MFDNFELTVVRIEGLGNLSKSTCYISINKEPFESIFLKDLENSQHISTIPSKGDIRFSIEDQTVIASVKFNLSIIKCQGYHWLPLFLDTFDLLHEVPEEVGLPRILLIFNSRKFLSPVIEITETSEVSENIEYLEYSELHTEDITKNVELRLKIMELEKNLHVEKMAQAQNIEKLSRECKATVDKLNFEIEKHKIWTEKYKNKCGALNEEIETKNKAILEMKDESEILKAELNLYKSKYTEAIQNQESIFTILEAKDQEINDLKSKLINNAIDPMVFEVSHQGSISIAEKKVNNTENNLGSQRSASSANIEKKNKPKKKLIEGVPDKNSIHSSIFDSSDQIDFYLNESLSKLKLDGLFTKSTEQYYKIGSRKVGMILKNGNIYCKIGDAYKTLENYIFSHCNKELESFIKKRANSKPTHRRFHTFSTSFDNTLAQPLTNKSFKIESDILVQKPKKNKSITPILVRNGKK